MTAEILLPLIIKYGPAIVPLVRKLAADIAAGRGQQELTAADWAELERLAANRAADLYLAAGVTPPA